MKIYELIGDLSHNEIKERRWRRCRIFKKGKKIIFPDYVVSDRGEVMRITPPIDGRGDRTYPGRISKLSDKWDYICCKFRKNGKNYMVRVHRLVMESFIGERPKGKDINHKNGIKHYNYLENLEYVTRSENVKHAFRLGLQSVGGAALLKGEDQPNALLSNKEVNKIRKLWESGNFSQEKLGDKYHVSKSCISHIVNWHTWKSV